MSNEIKEVQEAVRALHETLESKGQESAEAREKLDKIDAKLDQYEEKSAKLTADLLEAKKLEEDHKERIDSLEAKLLRLRSGSEEYKEKTAEYKAFEKFILGDRSISAEEMKYLRTDVDPDGGYLAPVELSNELIRQITELSPVRQLARVMRTSRGSVEIPKRTGIPTAYRVGQGATDTQSNSAYGMQTLALHRMTVDVPISIEMLADAAFNMETEINQDAAEAFAKLEGSEFISGTGAGEFEGILTNADVANSNSGVANDITGDSLITLSGQLKDGYTGSYILNRTTLARVRRLKDGTGQYLWQNGLAAGLPNTINGDTYVSAIDMPNIGAGLTPVAYGDFMRAYRMADHTDMSVLRDSFSQSRSGKVLFIMHRRNAGKVVLAEAIKKLTCAV